MSEEATNLAPHNKSQSIDDVSEQTSSFSSGGMNFVMMQRSCCRVVVIIHCCITHRCIMILGKCSCCGLLAQLCGNESIMENTASEHVQNLLANNKKWVKFKKAREVNFFVELSKPQQPKYLYFGCADSRVPANEILGLP